jgi:glycerol uptake facilitator-like aquaporin
MATSKARTTTAKKKSTVKKKTAVKAAQKPKVVAASAAAVVAKQNESKLPTPGALIAEFLGVFALTGAFFALFGSGVTGAIGISLVLIGLVIVFAVISGAHFNPAVTIALWANRKIGGVKALLYILVQLFGALVAFFVFKAIFSATNGVDFFGGSEAIIIDNLINKQNVTAEMIEEAGGLLGFATANGFASIPALAERIGVTLFVENDISGNGMAAFFAELVGAIIFGFGAGVAYVKKNKPVVKALALGFALFAGLIISGSTAVLNPAIAAALGSFTHGWPVADTAANVADIMWPILTYIIISIAGVVIGVTAYRFMLKGAACGCCCDGKCDAKCKCECDCHQQ